MTDTTVSVTFGWLSERSRLFCQPWSGSDDESGIQREFRTGGAL
ncbi:MAG: hypothetical protein RIK87_21535 [Fuerstiella sp.]